MRDWPPFLLHCVEVCQKYGCDASVPFDLSATAANALFPLGIGLSTSLYSSLCLMLRKPDNTIERNPAVYAGRVTYSGVLGLPLISARLSWRVH